MFNISFEYPLVFLCIIPFILCAVFCKAKSAVFLMPHLSILQKSSKKSTLLVEILKYLTIILTITALASPYKILDTQLIKKDGLDIVLCLDSSGSMKEMGLNRFNIEQTRFSIVKELVKDFIDKRTNDNIALIVFGTSVMTATPLSFDKNAQKQIIDYLDIGIVGDKTAMFDSLASAVNILKESKAKSKIVILLSDGDDNSSTIPFPVSLKLLKKYDIKVYTITIGNNVQNVLEKIAIDTKGKAFSAKSKEELKQIYNQINALEKSQIEQNKIILKEYLYFYPLFIATIILILLTYIRNKE